MLKPLKPRRQKSLQSPPKLYGQGVAAGLVSRCGNVSLAARCKKETEETESWQARHVKEDHEQNQKSQYASRTLQHSVRAKPWSPSTQIPVVTCLPSCHRPTPGCVCRVVEHAHTEPKTSHPTCWQSPFALSAPRDSCKQKYPVGPESL